ncbi:alpha-amylase [Marinomonas sp. NPDC078689]
MSKKTSPQNNSSNQQNSNKGSNGTNTAYDKAQGNRGTQLNPNKKN